MPVVSQHFHHAIFTTSWKMNHFSRLFHQGAKCIFTRVSRHISRPTYFQDKFRNRKLSRHFHRLFTTHFHDVRWKSRENDIVQRYIFRTFSRRFAPVVFWDAMVQITLINSKIRHVISLGPWYEGQMSIMSQVKCQGTLFPKGMGLL